MTDYGNYVSDDSNDDIGFPKTPGEPLQARQSIDDSDNEVNQISENDSDSEHSEKVQKRYSDSEDDQSKPPNADSDDEEEEANKSNNSGNDSDSNHVERTRRSSKNDKSSDNDNSSSSSDENQDEADKKSSSSGSESNNRRPRKRAQAFDSSDEEDSDQEKNNSENKTADTTAQDLFGELSDEDEDALREKNEANNVAKRARIDDSDEDEPQVDRAVMNDIFGSDEDEIGYQEGAENEEIQEEPRIEIDIPRVRADLGEDMSFVKMPNFLSVNTHPYDPQWYEDEIDEDEVQDDEGRSRLKLKVENTIRWRRVLLPDGTVDQESNARVVKWSDGSMSLHLGEEIFDMHKLAFQPGEHNHLFVRQGSGLQGQAIFGTKLIFRPFSTESFTHRKLTLSLADRSLKTQKICVLPSVGKDPEAHRLERIKKEEDKLKASIRKESKQRRVKDRAYSRGATLNYLEHEDDDDESISISKIKNQYKRGPSYPAGSSGRYSGLDSDEDADAEPPLDDDDSDSDSDEDMFNKKRTEKKKIVESDDED